MLVLNWFGDSLDGTVARVRNKQRPRFGFYVDHVIDAFGAVFLIGGMTWSGMVHWQIAMAMLIAFLLLSIETYLATYALGRFHLSHGLFGPTEIRILLIIANAALLRSVSVHLGGHEFLLLDAGGAMGGAAMVAILLYACVRHTAELYRQESSN